MKIRKLHFGQFQIYPNIMIGEIFEGIHFNQLHNDVVWDLALSEYGTDREFGYISNRTQTYSIDPMVHYKNRGFSNLKCMAIVEPNGVKPSTIGIESKFFNKDGLQAFCNIKDAMAWVTTVLQKSKGL